MWCHWSYNQKNLGCTTAKAPVVGAESHDPMVNHYESLKSIFLGLPLFPIIHYHIFIVNIMYIYILIYIYTDIYYIIYILYIVYEYIVPMGHAILDKECVFFLGRPSLPLPKKKRAPPRPASESPWRTEVGGLIKVG